MTRFFQFLFVTLVLSAAVSASAQQAQPNPAEVALRKMRDSLRNTMIQLQTAEADKAAAQAELATTKAENEKKIKDLTKELDALRKKSNEERNAAEKSITDLTSKVANTEQSLAKTKETLTQWKAGYAKAAALSVKKDAERAEAAAKVVAYERRVLDNETKNAEMFKIANEVLDRYKGFGLGTALVAREPFTGIMRVKLQNLMQSYQDKLIAQKIRPADYNSGTPPEAPASSAPAPATKATPPPPAKPEAPNQKASDTKAKS